LAHHSQQRPGKLGTDELLAFLWKGIKDPANGRWRVVGVHGSNHKVPGFRRRNRSLDRLGVPHLAYNNDVRILSQCILESLREIARVISDLARVHQASPLRVNKFDRVFNTDNVDRTPSGYCLGHARQCCAFAFTARARHEYQTGSLVTPLVQYRRMSQGIEIADLRGNTSKIGLNRTGHIARVSAIAP